MRIVQELQSLQEFERTAETSPPEESIVIYTENLVLAPPLMNC
jgi:hypothetical protein